MLQTSSKLTTSVKELVVRFSNKTDDELPTVFTTLYLGELNPVCDALDQSTVIILLSELFIMNPILSILVCASIVYDKFETVVRSSSDVEEFTHDEEASIPLLDTLFVLYIRFIWNNTIINIGMGALSRLRS